MNHPPVYLLPFVTVPMSMLTDSFGVSSLTNVTSAPVVVVAVWPVYEFGHRHSPQCSEQEAHSSRISTAVGNPR